jgi:hypothetical protein
LAKQGDRDLGIARRAAIFVKVDIQAWVFTGIRGKNRVCGNGRGIAK